jgi:hypothetical protein
MIANLPKVPSVHQGFKKDRYSFRRLIGSLRADKNRMIQLTGVFSALYINNRTSNI